MHCGCGIRVAADAEKVNLLISIALSVCRPQYEQVYKPTSSGNA